MFINLCIHLVLRDSSNCSYASVACTCIMITLDRYRHICGTYGRFITWLPLLSALHNEFFCQNTCLSSSLWIESKKQPVVVDLPFQEGHLNPIKVKVIRPKYVLSDKIVNALTFAYPLILVLWRHPDSRYPSRYFISAQE